MTNQTVTDEPFGFTVEGVLNAAGGRAAVAKACGISIQSVAKWTRRIPDAHAQRVAVLAGLPLEVVRPDMARRGHEQAKQYAEQEIARR